MDGQVGSTLDHGFLHGADEGTHFGEFGNRTVPVAISLGSHLHQLDRQLGMGDGQKVGHSVSLGEG
jgi:hypothetical protein